MRTPKPEDFVEFAFHRFAHRYRRERAGQPLDVGARLMNARDLPLEPAIRCNAHRNEWAAGGVRLAHVHADIA